MHYNLNQINFNRNIHTNPICFPVADIKNFVFAINSSFVLLRFYSLNMLQIAPEKLLEISKQKNESEEAQQKRRINLTTIALAEEGPDYSNAENESEIPVGSASSFGFPNHAAFKSFFKVKQVTPPKKTPLPVRKKQFYFEHCVSGCRETKIFENHHDF